MVALVNILDPASRKRLTFQAIWNTDEHINNRMVSSETSRFPTRDSMFVRQDQQLSRKPSLGCWCMFLCRLKFIIQRFSNRQKFQ